MVIRDQAQALSVAIEMEKRAIRTYERALMIVKDAEVAAGIQKILADEKEHLRRFYSLRNMGMAVDAEDRILSEAMAADALFSGGVMEMARRQGLESVKDLYIFAADSEKAAVENYTAFAGKCTDEDVKRAFMTIAAEESGHLTTLNRELEKL